jgi:uncharacterized protein with HEPN domain
MLYLEDILESVKNIQSYVGKSTFNELLKDRMRVDAVVRNFEIIGEAASKIPKETRDKYPSVEWRRISDFRNVLAHGHFGVDYELMWEIIKEKLPELERQIKSIIEQEKSSPQ